MSPTSWTSKQRWLGGTNPRARAGAGAAWPPLSLRLLVKSHGTSSLLFKFAKHSTLSLSSLLLFELLLLLLLLFELLLLLFELLLLLLLLLLLSYCCCYYCCSSYCCCCCYYCCSSYCCCCCCYCCSSYCCCYCRRDRLGRVVPGPRMQALTLSSSANPEPEAATPESRQMSQQSERAVRRAWILQTCAIRAISAAALDAGLSSTSHPHVGAVSCDRATER